MNKLQLIALRRQAKQAAMRIYGLNDEAVDANADDSFTGGNKMKVEMVDGKVMTIETGVIDKLKQTADDGLLQEIAAAPALCERLNNTYFVTEFPRVQYKEDEE